MFLQGEPFEKGSPSHPAQTLQKGKAGVPRGWFLFALLSRSAAPSHPQKSGQSGGNIPKKEEKRGQKRKKLKKYGD